MTVRPDTIDNTGVTMVWGPLQSWLTSLSPGDVAELLPGDQFRVDFKLRPKTSMVCNGGRARIFTLLDANGIDVPERTNFRHITWDSVDDIEVSGIDVEGAKPPAAPYNETGGFQGQHGFEFLGCHQVDVHDCSVKHVRGDFCYFGEKKISKGVYRVCEDVTFTAFDGDDCGRQGIALVSGARYDIGTGVDLRNVGRSLFDIEANRAAAVVDDVRFHHVTATSVRNTMFACHGQAKTITDVEIDHVTMLDANIRTDVAGNVGRFGLSIHHCTSDHIMDSSQPPVKVQGWGDVTVYENYQRVHNRSEIKPGCTLNLMRSTYCVHDNEWPVYDKFTNQPTGADADQFSVIMLTGVPDPGNCTSAATTAPTVTSPILVGATSVSGTSSEADGTTVQVYVDDVAAGDPVVVTSGAWTRDGLTALTVGQVVTATATAEGKAVSAESDEVDVQALPVTDPPVVTAPITAGATIVSGTSTEADGTTVQVHVDGTPAGDPVTVTAGAWTRDGLPALVAGEDVTARATAAGETISPPSDAVTVSEPPPTGTTDTPVVTSPIFVGATTVNGTSTEADGTEIQVIVDGTPTGTTTTVTDGAWSRDGLGALAVDEVVTATATASGELVSEESDPVVVSALPQADRPTLNAPIYVGATSVSGTSSEPDATIVVRVSNIIIGTTDVVAGQWVKPNLTPLTIEDSVRAQALVAGKTNSSETPRVFVSEPPPIFSARVSPKRIRWRGGAFVPPF